MAEIVAATALSKSSCNELSISKRRFNRGKAGSVPSDPQSSDDARKLVPGLVQKFLRLFDPNEIFLRELGFPRGFVHQEHCQDCVNFVQFLINLLEFLFHIESAR